MRIILLILFSLLGVHPLDAAEVKNLITGQTGDRGFATYDLAGKPGEKQADVTVVIELGNDRYPADKLSLSGDFGKGVKVGVGKKIFWDVLKDMPAGFEGEVVWDVEASGTPVGAKQGSSASPGSGGDSSKGEAGKAFASPLRKPTTAMEFEKDGFKFYKDVVVDSSTGLMWTRNGNISGKEMNWDDAISWVKNLNYSGYNDWRLPTKEEFEIFVKRTEKRPFKYFNGIGFNSVQASSYWSGSSNYSFGTVVAWGVNVDNGIVNSILKTGNLYVWPVRRGQ